MLIAGAPSNTNGRFAALTISKVTHALKHAAVATSDLEIRHVTLVRMWGTNATTTAGVNRDERDWQQAHRALSRLARERAAADAEEGRWLLAALRSATHVHLGFSSFVEYIERLFGYSPRSTQERLRVAEALEQLPATRHALEHGDLSWSAARELTRVAVADTEREWLAAGADKTVRQLEALVAGAQPGDLPTSPRDPSLRPRVLRFEVTAETYALFREAASQLRRRSDARLDDDALLMTMARAVLQGPSDEGRSSYQVALSVCPECGNGAQLAAGELLPVAPEVAAMAQCDGQHIGPSTTPANDDAASSVDAHVDANARAKQSIRPATRRSVMQRDQRRCRVPGCCNATFVDVHHITARADGGSDAVQNLIVLCGAHHRAAHRGELVIEGDTAERVRFRHADGSRYGAPANPDVLDVLAKVFKALCKLGFREREVRRVLDELRREPAVATATVESLLRDALGRLTAVGPTSSHRAAAIAAQAGSPS
jgi:hypothetical protein